MVRRCRKGEEVWSLCGLQAFHSEAGLDVHLEIDSHRLYLFSTICSDHVCCWTSSSNGKVREPCARLRPCPGVPTGQTPTITGLPQGPSSAQLVGFHGFCQAGCTQSGQPGWVCMSRHPVAHVVSPVFVAGVSRSPLEGLCAERDWTTEPCHRQACVFTQKLPRSFHLAPFSLANKLRIILLPFLSCYFEFHLALSPGSTELFFFLDSWLLPRE